MQSTLVLDQGFRPVRTISWQQAITDYFLGKLEIVSEDGKIRTVTEEYPRPSVVRMLRAVNRRQFRVRFSRIAIFSRDGFRCQYCGVRFLAEDLQFDHVLPRAQGGKTTWENVVSSCSEHNRLKANRTPEQAGMRLIKKPVKPKYLPSVDIRATHANVPKAWRQYWDYSLTEESWGGHMAEQNA